MLAIPKNSKLTLTQTLLLHTVPVTREMEEQVEGLLQAFSCEKLASLALSQMALLEKPSSVEDLWDKQYLRLREQQKRAEHLREREDYEMSCYNSLMIALTTQSWINSFGPEISCTLTLEELARFLKLDREDWYYIYQAGQSICPWVLEFQEKKDK